MLDSQTEVILVLQIYKYVSDHVPDAVIPSIDRLCTLAQTNPIHIPMTCGILCSVALTNEVPVLLLKLLYICMNVYNLIYIYQ